MGVAPVLDNHVPHTYLSDGLKKNTPIRCRVDTRHRVFFLDPGGRKVKKREDMRKKQEKTWKIFASHKGPLRALNGPPKVEKIQFAHISVHF